MNLRSSINLALLFIFFLSGVYPALATKRKSEYKASGLAPVFCSSAKELNQQLLVLKNILSCCSDYLLTVSRLPAAEQEKLLKIKKILREASGKNIESFIFGLIDELIEFVKTGYLEGVQLLVNMLKNAYGEARKKEFASGFVKDICSLRTSLFGLACEKGHLEIVRLFIATLREAYGKDDSLRIVWVITDQNELIVKDRVGNALWKLGCRYKGPLYLACKHDHSEVIKLLVITLIEVCGESKKSDLVDFLKNYSIPACSYFIRLLFLDTLKEKYGESIPLDFNSVLEKDEEKDSLDFF